MDGKKITFAFNKINKKPNLIKEVEVKKVEYIKSLEDNQLKFTGPDPNATLKEKIVIPLTNDQKTTPLSKLIENKKKSQIEKKLKADQNKAYLNSNDKNNSENSASTSTVDLKEETLEQRAAREIIESTKNDSKENIEEKIFTLPLKPDELPLNGAQEPTLDDYEQIPISDFGKAMLRGMGWKDEEEKKSMKNNDIPIQRPKGLGLGADKAIKPLPQLIPPGKDEKLEIKKNAFVKVLAGKHKTAYGQIEGFDSDGRTIVKLAIGGVKESFNDFLLQPVSKEEFTKYGKILNSEKYAAYKSSENKSDVKIKTEEVKGVKHEKEKEKYREESRGRSEKYFRDDENRSYSSTSTSSRNHKNDDNKYNTESNSKSSSSRKETYYISSGDSDDEKSNRKYHDRARSRSKDRNKSRKSSESSSSDEYRSKKKSSHKSSKKSSKSKKSHSSEQSSSRNRNYSSDEYDSDKKHKKKTKRSKKQRSRS